MLYEPKNYYPDYLKDFEYLDEISLRQYTLMNRWCITANAIIAAMLGHHALLVEEWQDIFDVPNEGGYNEMVHEVHKKRIVFSLQDFKDILFFFTNGGKCTVEFNEEELTFYVKYRGSRSEITHYTERIRHLIPYNMNVVIEYVPITE